MLIEWRSKPCDDIIQQTAVQNYGVKYWLRLIKYVLVVLKYIPLLKWKYLYYLNDVSLMFRIFIQKLKIIIAHYSNKNIIIWRKLMMHNSYLGIMLKIFCEGYWFACERSGICSDELSR